MSEKRVNTTLERIGKDMGAMQKGHQESCKRFLEYYGKLLHSNHFYLTEVKFVLAQLIGQEAGLESVDDDDLDLKMKLCIDVNSILKRVAPGTYFCKLYLKIN